MPRGVLWVAVGEGSQRLEVLEVRSVAGGEDDGVYLLAGAVGPDDAVVFKGGEHRSVVELACVEHVAVPACVRDKGGWDDPG
jgi:hypothetical protein